ncbi:MAG: SDR family NAD(P)-dependent oxidoreductase [Hyphomicrobiaceae bacterium]
MSNSPGFQRVIALGALSAIGEATLRLHAAEGARLVVAGRNEDRLRTLAADLEARGASSAVIWCCDLAGTDDPRAALDSMAASIGGIDSVLLFYGTLGDNGEAERNISAARDILRTNFSSAAEWCLAAADVFEAQGHGDLVVIGSVAGDRGRQSNYIYGAAKGGLALLVQGIAHRLAACGGRAVVVKPGFVDTPMTAGLQKGGPLWAKPEAVAKIIKRAASRNSPVVYAPGFWRWIMLAIRAVPSPVFHRTKL